MSQVSLELYTWTHIMVGTLDIGRYRLSDFLCDPTSDIVPLEAFFVRSHFGVPAVSPAWTLEIAGLVEKPITLISDEARQLTELAEKNKRILQVGHIFRFDPASLWLRDSIQAGQFGRVNILRSNFSGFKRPRNDSGVTFADAIHFVDLFNYLLGGPPMRVSAVMKDFLGRGMDDASLISLEYETAGGTAWGLVETNYFLPGKFREVTVVGSELTAVCDYNVSQYKIKTFANKHVRSANDFKAEEGAQQVPRIDSNTLRPNQATPAAK